MVVISRQHLEIDLLELCRQHLCDNGQRHGQVVDGILLVEGGAVEGTEDGAVGA